MKRFLLSLFLTLSLSSQLFAFGFEDNAWFNAEGGSGAATPIFQLPLSSLDITRGAGPLTFTRASDQWGTNNNGTLTKVAANVPYFNSRGLLCEPSATNLLLQSQTITVSPWGQIGTSVTRADNQTTAPDGTNTASSLLSANATSGHHLASQVVTIPSAGVYTYSAYVKRAGMDYAYISLQGTSNAQSIFNLATGAVGTFTVGNPLNPTITPLANGWYKISVSLNCEIAGSYTFYIAISSTDNYGVTSETAGTGIYFWNPQVETGSVATSPILNVATSVPRSATVLSIPTSGNLPANNFTIALNYTPLGSTLFQNLFGTYVDGNNFFALQPNFTAGKLRLAKYAGGSYVGFVDFDVTFSVGTTYKIAARVNADNSMDLFVNGVKGTTSADTTTIPISATLNIGSLDSLNQASGYERDFRIYGKSMTDQQLINLTR